MRRIEYTIVLAALTAFTVMNLQAFAQAKITVNGQEVDTKRTNRRANPAPEAPLTPPKIEEPTFTAQGGFLSTKEKARESALLAATDMYADYLKAQGIDRKPTTSMIRNMIVRHKDVSSDDWTVMDKVIEETIDVGGTSEKVYRVEVAVKVRNDDVRRMRALDRSSEALWILAGLGALAGVGAVFFRVDAWTKGYLTSWLVLGTVGAGGLLLGLWWWAR